MKYLLICMVAVALPLGAHAQTAVPRAITVAGDGTILIGTTGPGVDGTMRMNVTGYNPDGSLRGYVHREVETTTAVTMQMAATSGGDVVIAGTGGDAQSPHDIVVFGFDLSSIVSVDKPGALQAFTLSPAYPNPITSGTATVAFSTEVRTDVRLVVRDLSGREVQIIRTGSVPAGHHEQQIKTGGLPPGTYFVILESSVGIRTQKLLVVK